jgi:hypothetical protein
LEQSDQLVRLSFGHAPLEAAFSDWATLCGYVLYLLTRTDGRVEYLYAPLDSCILASVRVSERRGARTIYRYANGRLTPFGRYLALFLLGRHVHPRAIASALGTSMYVLKRLESSGTT